MRGVILLAEQRKLVFVPYRALQTGQKWNQELITSCSIYWRVLEDPGSALPQGKEEGPAQGKAVGLVCLCVNCPITPGLQTLLLLLVNISIPFVERAMQLTQRYSHSF